ncbi:MAG: hypothetical protein JWR34_613 [Mycobacterium sp.]|nr:hypothetical protein [Mycobacterium sp.]
MKPQDPQPITVQLLVGGVALACEAAQTAEASPVSLPTPSGHKWSRSARRCVGIAAARALATSA